jgi:8-oxo-dGTP pyrophosphatase MutT (NUDIX family)
MAVFMVRRHGQSPFMPGVFVFPGGTVHTADQAAEGTPGLCMPPAEPAPPFGGGFRVAAIRECFEEAGVLLAYRDGSLLDITGADQGRFAGHRAALLRHEEGLAAIVTQEGLLLATDLLLHWGHWITPEGLPRRFTTHFFLAAMPEGQDAEYDGLETTAGIWIAPEEALARHAQDGFPLAFPTIRQLRTLAGLSGMDAARARFAGRPVLPIQPMLSASGQEILLDDEP